MSASVVFVAVHQGPYQTIAALETRFEAQRTSIVYLVEGIARQWRKGCGLPYTNVETLEREFGDLEGFLRTVQPKAIIRSTSEGAPEPNPERWLSRAATRADIPVFVIEDFPGNYHASSEERLDGLFVEHDMVRTLHVSRGVDGRRIYVATNPRYESLTQIDRASRRHAVRLQMGLEYQQVVLWVGQPDGRNSYDTFERIFPCLRAVGATVLFRAHPRDTWYQGGRYKELLERWPNVLQDVSATADVLNLCCASDLVITQFSSIGVEALYLGVPTVFVLFDDLGKRYLRIHKGYEFPPWCMDECAFVIQQSNESAQVIGRALGDEKERQAVCRRFAQRFAIESSGTEGIVSVVERSMAQVC